MTVSLVGNHTRVARLTREDEQTHDEEDFEEREVKLSLAEPSYPKDVLRMLFLETHVLEVLTNKMIETRKSVHQTALLISVFQ